MAPDAPPLVAPLTITNEENPTKVTIGSEGGSIAVTNGAGTKFALDVPAGALLSPLEITATPVSFGDNDVRAQGVVYGPAGLSFTVAATLKVTPVAPIPVARQLVFTFTDDGRGITAAEPSLGTEDVVIVATHFSGYGFGDLTNLADKARGGYARWKAAGIHREFTARTIPEATSQWANPASWVGGDCVRRWATSKRNCTHGRRPCTA